MAVPLTVKQLMKASQPEVRERSRHCNVRRVGKAITTKSKRRGQVITEQYRAQCRPETAHVCRIEFLGKGKDLPVKDEDSPVWVTCTCEYFLFFCEYALTRRGSSSIIHGNGEPPVVRNSRMYPWVCKHLVRAFMASLTTYRKK